MAQSDLPTPLSQVEILGTMMDTLVSKTGITRLKVGNPLLSLLECVSLTQSKATYDVLKALKAKDIDNTTGVALQSIGADEKLPQLGPQYARTNVNFSDSSITKIGSNISHAGVAPIAGSLSVNVDKTPTFEGAPSTGNIYIGRGTSQSEGPLAYTGKVNNGSYWTLTLSSPTSVFHNLGEEVVVGQGGDRPINAGQAVFTAPGVLSAPIQYTVVTPGSIPDGEVELLNVPVVCTTLGTIGNVPEDTITDFNGSPPFTGAAVTNPSRVTSGRDTETTKQYRDRIKTKRNTRIGGTDLAIANAAKGVTASDESKTVLSSSLLRRLGKPSILTIDDGNGYQPIWEGSPYEVLRSISTGGEKDFKVLNRPIVLASVETLNTSPFPIANGTTLKVIVGNGSEETHTFNTTVFNDPASGSSYDLVSSINNNASLGFYAKVSANSSKLTLYPKTETDSIQVTGGTANEILGFSTSKSYTALLYKNDRYLTTTTDYVLDRATGDLTLISALEAGDTLAMGSLWSRGFVESANITSLTLDDDVTLWAAVDNNIEIIDSGNGIVSTLTVAFAEATPSSYHATVKNSTAFDRDAQAGDSLLLYTTDTNNLPSALNGVHKIIRRSAIDSVVIELPQMRSARKLATATNFPAASKKVLICGGLCGQTGGLLNTAEVYDTATGEFTQTAPMTYARYGHTATLLNNGKIFVAGGFGVDGLPVRYTELYDTSSNTWAVAAHFGDAAFGSAAILLETGNVMITGGVQANNTVVAHSSTYSVGADAFSAQGDFDTARYGHTLIRLDTDDIFMVGGFTSAINNKSCTYTCNLYNHLGDTWGTKSALPIVSTVTPNRNAVGELYASGSVVAVVDSNYYTYDVGTDAWTLVGDIATEAGLSDVTIYNGTSVKSLDTNYFHAGMANPIIKSANGTLAILFAEYTDSVTGKRKPVHLVYNDGTNKWEVTQVPDNVSGCKSMYASVGLNGAGHEDEVMAFGGQATDIYYEGGEEVIGATPETFNTSSKAITYNSPLFTTFPGDQGWCIFRNDSHVAQCTIPAGENYTSQTLANLITFDGAFSNTYQTNRIRVSTDDHVGAFSLLGPTVAGVETETTNSSGVSLCATSKSVRSEKDIPYDFEVFSIGATYNNTAVCPLITDVFESANVNPIAPPNTPRMAEMPLNGTLVGLSKKNFLDGNSEYEVNIDEYGNFKAQIARISSWAPSGIASVENGTIPTTITLGIDAAVPIIPNQPFYCGSAFSFTPEEVLSVTVDNDTTSGLFMVPMHRKLKPVGTTYGSQIIIRDLDNGSLKMAKAFGVDYEFENFDVLMQARNKIGNILYRFYRWGAEGENYVVRYQYPTTPDAVTKVSTTYSYQVEPNIYSYARKSFIDISLPSGAAYTNTAFTPTSQLALTQVNSSKGVCDLHILSGLKVASYWRGSAGDQTILTLEFPSEDIMLDTLATNVINEGQFIRFDAVTSTPTTLQSGQTQIVYVGNRNLTTIDIGIIAGSLDDGTASLPLTLNPGTISFDPTAQAAVTFDASISAGDIVVLKSPLHFNNNPMRVVDTGDTYQWLHCKAIDFGNEDDTHYMDVIKSPNNLVIFAKPTSTEASLVSDITALFESGDSPISATSIGAGATAVEKASWDTASDWEAGYPLLDGYNAVLSTVKPATTDNDTEIVLKKAVTGSLATNTDWANEILYIAPQYAKDVVKWLNTPCVTGLWSRAEVKTADGGTSVQVSSLTPGSLGSIQISGIGANSTAASILNTIYTSETDSDYPWSVVTARGSDASYFSGNSWVKITNSQTLPKTILTSGNVNTIASDGTITFSANPYLARGERISCTATIEPAGDFCVIKLGSSMSSISVTDGDFICIEDPVNFSTSLPYISDINKGTFRVVRHSHNNSVFWIENPDAVFEKCTLSAIVISYDSVVPGDKIIISDIALGVNNKGTWDIVAVGSSTSSSPMFEDSTITVSIADKTPTALNSATAFGASSIQFTEGEPSVLYKKILGLSINADNSELTDIKLLGQDIGLISAATGSVMTALNKLEFPAGINIGTDAYKYNTGLVREVNKVLYGDSSDTQTYPGVVSNGASVLIDGPVIKRVKATFAVRINGNPSKDLADRIKSMVAGVINSSPHGQNIAVSALTTACDTVDGVMSTTPVGLSDQIIVNSQEKAMVLNLDDVSVVFMGQ